jgi:hypothetical protein
VPTIDLAPDRTHTVYVASVDNAGNKERPHAEVYKFDPPRR